MFDQWTILDSMSIDKEKCQSLFQVIGLLVFGLLLVGITAVAQDVHGNGSGKFIPKDDKGNGYRVSEGTGDNPSPVGVPGGSTGDTGGGGPGDPGPSGPGGFILNGVEGWGNRISDGTGLNPSPVGVPDGSTGDTGGGGPDDPGPSGPGGFILNGVEGWGNRISDGTRLNPSPVGVPDGSTGDTGGGGPDDPGQSDGSEDSYRVVSTLVDDGGNTWFLGTFRETLTIGEITLVSRGETDLFLAVFDPWDRLLWALGIGSTGDDHAFDFLLDTEGGITLTGLFSNELSLGGRELVSLGGYDVLLARYTSTGTLSWAKQIGGSGDDDLVTMSETYSGHIVLEGSFSNRRTFGEEAFTHHELIPFNLVYKSSGTLVGMSLDEEYSP